VNVARGARCVAAVVLLLALAPAALAAEGDVVDEAGLLGTHRESVEAVVDAAPRPRVLRRGRRRDG
jgi:hypothetical protein